MTNSIATGRESLAGKVATQAHVVARFPDLATRPTVNLPSGDRGSAAVCGFRSIACRHAGLVPVVLWPRVDRDVPRSAVSVSSLDRRGVLLLDDPGPPGRTPAIRGPQVVRTVADRRREQGDGLRRGGLRQRGCGAHNPVRQIEGYAEVARRRPAAPIRSSIPSGRPSVRHPATDPAWSGLVFHADFLRVRRHPTSLNGIGVGVFWIAPAESPVRIRSPSPMTWARTSRRRP